MSVRSGAPVVLPAGHPAPPAGGRGENGCGEKCPEEDNAEPPWLELDGECELSGEKGVVKQSQISP